MILSRLWLNPLQKEVRRDLADCREMHRTIMSVFPDAPPQTTDRRKHFGVLYRIEDESRTGRIMLLLQSGLLPDWTNLPSNYLLAGDMPASKDLRNVLAALRDGMVLNFRLRANPTVSRGGTTKTEREHSGCKRNAKRYFLADSEAQIKWLQTKAYKGGFEILTVTTKGGVACKVGERNSTGKFSSADFNGLLRVTDSEKFRQVLSQGIGPEKSYGCGLLSIAPAGY